jgi:cellulose synthase operon protein C
LEQNRGIYAGDGSDMNKTGLAMLMVVMMFMMQPSYAQQETSQDIGKKVKIDSLLDSYSTEEIIKFRDFYQQQIDSLEKEKLALRDQTILDTEKFVKENPESKVLDKVLMRLAELYYDIANETFLKRMQEYYQLLLESISTQVVTILGEPKRDFSKSLAIYERVIKEMPNSNLVGDAYFNTGRLLYEIGETDSALKVQYRIKNQFSESRYVSDALINIADYYFNSPHNLLDSAVTYYKKLLEYKDNLKYNEALYKLGQSYCRMNDFDEAKSCFTFLLDEIIRERSFDPEKKVTIPNLREKVLENIGICFINHGGTSAAIDYISNLGTPVYGFDILRKLGNRYMQEQKLFEEAIRTYTTLLMMYPNHVHVPEIHEKIVSCFILQDEKMFAYLQRDELFNLFKPGSNWWRKNSDEAIRENVYKITEAALRDNINFMFQQADSSKHKNYYRLAVVDCQKYLQTFPDDSSAQKIHWNMALTVDNKLKQYEQAYEEYMKICDFYWNSDYQRWAAENAIALAKKAVEMDTSRKELFVQQNPGREFQEQKKNVPTPYRFKRINLNQNEKKLIRAYNSYIKLYPHLPATNKILANAGTLFFNNKMFPEALRYFNTAVKHFPDQKDVNKVKYQAVLSYLRKSDYKSAEIISRQLKNLKDIEPELQVKAKRLLAESIFLAAKLYADSSDFLRAADEYLRVVREVPNVAFADRCLFNAALEYDKAKEFSRAVETYNFLIETQEESKLLCDAMNNLAIDYGRLEEYRNAALTFKRLFSQTNETKQAHDALYNSSLFFVKGEYWQEAINTNFMFVEKYPDSEQTNDMFFKIAQYYLNLNNPDKANQIYGEYVETFPNSPSAVEACFYRGRYFESKNELIKASLEYQKAVAKNELFHQTNLEKKDYFAAEALFYGTKIKFREFIEIEFLLPLARMEEAKKKKYELLIEIVDGFKKVSSYGTARLYEATFYSGRIYEEFAHSWARQEIPPIDRAQRIMRQKEINTATVDLYENAEDSFRQAILFLKREAEEYERELFTADTSGKSIEKLKVIIARDSTLQIANNWIARCEKKLIKAIYDMAELNLNTVNSFINTPLPEGLSRLAQLDYSKKIFNQTVTPLINEIIDEHLRLVKEAKNMDIEDQLVKLSGKKAISINNTLAEQYKKLAHNALDLYAEKVEAYRQLIENSDASIYKDNDVFLTDQLTTLNNYYEEFARKTIKNYAQTLDLTHQKSIQDSISIQVSENLFKNLYEVVQKSKQLTQSINANKKIYYKRFKETNKQIYEDAFYTFKDNYESIKKNNLQLLEQGYQTSREKQIDNRWTKRIILALVEEDPREFCSLLDLKIEHKIVTSDRSWRVSDKNNPDWTAVDFNDELWKIPEYTDMNEMLFAQDSLAIWMKINDTTGIFYDTTYVVDFDFESFFTDVFFLSGGVVLDDSLHQDSTIAAEANKNIIVIPRPEIVRINSDKVFFRKNFEIPGLPVSAEIRLNVDDSYNLYLNGEFVAADTSISLGDSITYVHDLTDLLIKDKNVIAIEVKDRDKSGGGLVAKLDVAWIPGWEEKMKQIPLRYAQ